MSAGGDLWIARQIINGPPGMSSVALARGYRAQVEELAPNKLLCRNQELTLMAEFCRGDEPYLWWQAGPWSGKTALLAWFALHKPDDVDIACFFIRATTATASDFDGYLGLLHR